MCLSILIFAQYQKLQYVHTKSTHRREQETNESFNLHGLSVNTCHMLYNGLIVQWDVYIQLLANWL